MRLSCRLLAVDRPGRSWCFHAVVQASNLELYASSYQRMACSQLQGGAYDTSTFFSVRPVGHVLPSYFALLAAPAESG